MISLLESKREAIAELCKRYSVARLDAFGSALHEGFDSDESDVDLLVEFAPLAPYDRVNAYFGLLEALRELFDREIDLVMVGAVKNPYIARDIEQTKQVLYAA